MPPALLMWSMTSSRLTVPPASISSPKPLETSITGVAAPGSPSIVIGPLTTPTSIVVLGVYDPGSTITVSPLRAFPAAVTMSHGSACPQTMLLVPFGLAYRSAALAAAGQHTQRAPQGA